MLDAISSSYHLPPNEIAAKTRVQRFNTIPLLAFSSLPAPASMPVPVERFLFETSGQQALHATFNH
jgi:hypothetical protein